MYNEIGKRYGYLTMVEDTRKRHQGSIVYKCLFDCGNYKKINSNKLHNYDIVFLGCASENKE